MTVEALLERARRYALVDPAAGDVAFSQAGTLRLAPGKPWKRFTARQTIAPDPPGFNWQARVRLMPLVSVRVTDALENGVGRGEVRMFGLPVARDSGPQLATAQLTRWLAELPWCPGILHSPLIQWTADGSKLTAAIDEARVTFDVAGDGRILKSSALRHRRVGKGYAVTPWQGTFNGEITVQGMRLPAGAEVAWLLPEGACEVWRGEISRYRFDTATRLPETPGGQAQ